LNEVKVLIEVAAALARLRVSFFIAGGWAIDLHLGRVTREHHDVDVSILRCHQSRLHESLDGWTMKKIIPHPEGLANRGTLADWRPGERLEQPVHQINVYRRGETEPALQVMLEESSNEEWIYRRNPAIRMPVKRMGFHSLQGLPYLAPEIVLLFKSKHLQAHDRIDFNVALPALSSDSRIWLRAALERSSPDHEWLAAL
jgi:aminoglycoside-2''-adenylyltransferase